MDTIDEYLRDIHFTKLGLIVTLLAIYIVYKIAEYKKGLGLLKKYNIPRAKGMSFKPIELLKLHMMGLTKYDTDLMKRNETICGTFADSRLEIFTADLDFIKAATIKDFHHFVNRDQKPSQIFTKPFDKMMFFLTDEEWKNVRTLCTPTFTSGKLKFMSKLVNKCSENFEITLQDLVEKGDGILDTKKYLSCYALDVISSCCFGIDTDSIKDPDNEFAKHFSQFIRRDSLSQAKLLIMVLFPKFTKKINQLLQREVFTFSNHSSKFIENVTNQIIQNRKNKIQTRDDFIQNMVDHEQSSNDNSINKEKTLTNDEIMSQAFIFLLAGYDTVSSTFDFIAYNLATNPDHQETLCLEIDTVLENHDGHINYDSINDMKFLEMVIFETLRIYPAIPRLNREVTSDYKYKEMFIKKGSLLEILVYVIHHNPDIYPDPEKFDPYRFDEETKKTRDSNAYLPFGSGPRSCIGMRFALLEIKMLIARILSKYKFVKCEQTQVPLVLKKSIVVIPAKPIKVKVEKRF